MVGLLAHLHAREDCLIYLFHAVTPQDDDLRREIEALVDSSIVLPGDLQAAREAISEARLDVLFYPDIGMSPISWRLSNARPGGIQSPRAC